MRRLRERPVPADPAAMTRGIARRQPCSLPTTDYLLPTETAMGRHIGPVCRLCRREGTKLFLKGTRCDTPKCAVDRREGVPGMHQFRRGKASEYAIRLREKQKVKRYYGIFERQFRKYYAEASRRPGNTGDALMSLLERRLDNVVTRLGFAMSRPQARQMITHGHITGQRPEARHPQLPGPPRRPDPGQEPRALPQAGRREPGHRGRPAGPRVARPRQHRPARGPRVPPADRPGRRPARHAPVDHRVVEPLTSRARPQSSVLYGMGRLRCVFVGVASNCPAGSSATARP